MAEPRRLSEREIDHALRDLATRIDYPPTPDLTGAVRRRIQAQSSRRHWRPRLPMLAPSWPALAVAALAILFLGVAVLLAVSPSARTTVADRLGLRGVRIVVVPSPSPATTTVASPTPAATATSAPSPSAVKSATPGLSLDLGEPLTLEQARSRVAFQVLVPVTPDLQAPSAVYLDATPPGGMVSLVYGPRPDLPPIPSSDVGLLINEFQGSLDPNLFVKMADPSQIHVVTVNGSPGYWIAGGAHYLAYRDVTGNVQFQQTRLAGNTLLWEQDGLTFRLESQLGETEALAIAASLH